MVVKKRDLILADNLKSATCFGGTPRTSNYWLVSMFHNIILSEEHAKRWSWLSALKARCKIPDLSHEVYVTFSIFSRSQYLTVRSEDPLAIVSVRGLNCKQVTAWPGI